MSGLKKALKNIAMIRMPLSADMEEDPYAVCYSSFYRELLLSIIPTYFKYLLSNNANKPVICYFSSPNINSVAQPHM